MCGTRNSDSRFLQHWPEMLTLCSGLSGFWGTSRCTQSPSLCLCSWWIAQWCPVEGARGLPSHLGCLFPNSHPGTRSTVVAQGEPLSPPREDPSPCPHHCLTSAWHRKCLSPFNVLYNELAGAQCKREAHVNLQMSQMQKQLGNAGMFIQPLLGNHSINKYRELSVCIPFGVKSV